MNNTAKCVICYLTLRYWHEKQREECHVFFNTKEHMCGQTIPEKKLCASPSGLAELVEMTSNKKCLNFLVLGKQRKTEGRPK